MGLYDGTPVELKKSSDGGDIDLENGTTVLANGLGQHVDVTEELDTTGKFLAVCGGYMTTSDKPITLVLIDLMNEYYVSSYRAYNINNSTSFSSNHYANISHSNSTVTLVYVDNRINKLYIYGSQTAAVRCWLF